MNFNKVLILTLLSAIISSCNSQYENNNTHLAQNIVNGTNAQKLSTFGKSVVFIVLQRESGIPETCTGSFISPHHILTAAHCVTSDSSDTVLNLGVNPMENESEMVFTIDTIFVHPEHSKTDDNNRNDLAIIKIKETYKNEKYIFNLPVNSNSLLKYNKFDNTVTAIGYGQTNAIEGDQNQGDDIGVLRYVKLAANLSTEKNIIVSQSEGGGVCFGDSGGSITLRLQKKKYIVGVSSGVFGQQTSNDQINYCRDKSIFMNVIYYLPWIQKTIAL